MSLVESGDVQHGINLINTGHFFEAHEVLEDLWRPMPSADPHRRVMQGLVQVAVALHHSSVGNRTGALSVMRRASRNIAGAEEHALGIRFDLLRPAIDMWIAHVEQQKPSPPEIRIRRTADC